MGIGPSELWVILLIIVVLFGGRKIPEIMRGLGKGIREFKSAKDDLTGEDVPPAVKPSDDGTGKLPKP